MDKLLVGVSRDRISRESRGISRYRNSDARISWRWSIARRSTDVATPRCVVAARRRSCRPQNPRRPRPPPPTESGTTRKLTKNHTRAPRRRAPNYPRISSLAPLGETPATRPGNAGALNFRQELRQRSSIAGRETLSTPATLKEN